jgi:multidrug resistance efflux pump
MKKLPEDLKAAQAPIDKAEKSLAAPRPKWKTVKSPWQTRKETWRKSEALYQAGALSSDLLDGAKSKAASAQDLLRC